ncbi:hypothetical protein BDA96_09G099000 [Sorghum bicolor]|jgi:hypothetical protein|uniref:Uncharacterized protein n=2 Tax=Sorghum bicolor TaxID=4558 RepID=A0A921Q8M8_SORBI|nr:hypothetical protein BDA96_09G099000 [Sorghum bicolor]KXG21670.1 hypothetical protein SORBI_3009G094000 [Sorghum bicolor]
MPNVPTNSKDLELSGPSLSCLLNNILQDTGTYEYDLSQLNSNKNFMQHKVITEFAILPIKSYLACSRLYYHVLFSNSLASKISKKADTPF